ncbi:MAG: hypothetical protein QM831_32530 [Kofleriaceae bacterium]
MRLAPLALAACTAQVAHPIPVGVLGNVRTEPVAGLALTTVVLPAPPPPAENTATATLARVRTAYTHGNFDVCQKELASLDVIQLLADGDRASASRALAFATGCATGAMHVEDAKTNAARFASFGLDLTETTVSPDVEAVIGHAVESAGAAPRVHAMITSNAAARLTVDGRPAGCEVPCTIDLAPGEHVVAATADGFTPTHKTLRDADHLELELAPASSLLAAQQWRARIGRGLPPADPTGAALIGKFAGEPRVFVLTAGPRITGEAIVDGRTVAHGDAASANELVTNLAYDSGILHRPELWQRPWFWIAVGVGAVVIAGGIVALTYKPAQRAEVSF